MTELPPTLPDNTIRQSSTAQQNEWKRPANVVALAALAITAVSTIGNIVLQRENAATERQRVESERSLSVVAFKEEQFKTEKAQFQFTEEQSRAERAKADAQAATATAKTARDEASKAEQARGAAEGQVKDIRGKLNNADADMASLRQQIAKAEEIRQQTNREIVQNTQRLEMLVSQINSKQKELEHLGVRKVAAAETRKAWTEFDSLVNTLDSQLKSIRSKTPR